MRLSRVVPSRVFARLGEILRNVVVLLKNAADGVYSPCIMWTSVCNAKGFGKSYDVIPFPGISIHNHYVVNDQPAAGTANCASKHAVSRHTFTNTSSRAKTVKLSVWFLGTLEWRNPVGISSGWRQGNVSEAGRRTRAELQTSSSHLLGVT